MIFELQASRCLNGDEMLEIYNADLFILTSFVFRPIDSTLQRKIIRAKITTETGISFVPANIRRKGHQRMM
jgi:hypothetical protein